MGHVWIVGFGSIGHFLVVVSSYVGSAVGLDMGTSSGPSDPGLPVVTNDRDSSCTAIAEEALESLDVLVTAVLTEPDPVGE